MSVFSQILLLIMYIKLLLLNGKVKHIYFYKIVNYVHKALLLNGKVKHICFKYKRSSVNNKHINICYSI